MAERSWGTEVARTARLRLRELETGDLSFVFELLTDPDWKRFIGDRGVRTPEDAGGYVERIRGSYERHGFGLWVVEAQGLAIGLCGLVRREGSADPDLGFAFLPEGRGAGHAREAAEAVLGLAVAEHGLERVAAFTAPDNRRSIRLLERLGFRPDGRAALPGDGASGLRFLWRAPRPPGWTSPRPFGTRAPS